MKALFLDLNGETLYHHKGHIVRRRRRWGLWPLLGLLICLIDVLAVLFMLLS